MLIWKHLIKMLLYKGKEKLSTEQDCHKDFFTIESFRVLTLTLSAQVVMLVIPMKYL